MKQPVELVIIDVAAATRGNEEAVQRLLRDTLGAAGITVTPEQTGDITDYVNPAKIRALMTQGLGARPDDAQVSAVHAEVMERLIAFYESDPSVRETPGATGVFRQLKASGLKVALESDLNRPVLDVIMKRLGWATPELVDLRIASDEVSNGRPHLDMVLEAMRRSQVSSVEATAKVGDSPADLQDGMSAGCGYVIGVTHGSSRLPELMLCPHTHLIERFEELPGLLVGVHSQA